MFYYSNFNQNISNWNVSNVKAMNNIFSHSKFNHDLTNWKPISLLLPLDKDIFSNKIMFSNCPAPKPYWSEAQDVSTAVRSYWLNKELESSLIANEIKSNKIKI